MGIQINGQTDTVTATDGSINVGGDVTIPGVLTYEDVTNVDSVGVITARAGINATGDITFGANSNAKLFENGTQSGVQATNSSSSAHLMTHDGNEDIHVDPSGYIKVEVAGSERLRIDSDGKVCIGSASDEDLEFGTDVNAILQLSTASSPKIILCRDDTSVVTNDYLGIIDFHSRDGGIKRVARIGARAGGNHGADDGPTDLVFHTMGDNTATTAEERLRITYTGSVGIGTDNPYARNHIEIDVNAGAGSGSAGALWLKNANQTANNSATIFFGNNSSQAAGAINFIHKDYSTNAGDITFDTRANGSTYAERLRITSGGELKIPAGIGPQITFENQHGHTGDAVISTYDDGVGTLLCLGSNFYFSSGGAESRYNTSEESAGIVINRVGNIDFNTGDTSATAITRLRITSGGNVGVKVTNPDLTLHVNGVNALPSTSGSTPTGHLTLRAKATSSTHGMFMGVSNASPWSSWIQAQDATNNATNYPLLLNPNGGNVGINTINPAYKLDVRPTAEDPTTGSPAAGSFSQIRADDATVGKGPSLSLMNLSGSKETGWRLSALTASGNNGDFTIHGYNGGATYEERFRIRSDGQFETNGVRNIYETFRLRNDTTYNWDYTVPSEGGYGNSFYLVAGYNHYYTVAYGAHRTVWFSSRGTSVNAMGNGIEQFHSQSGSWTFSKPDSTTVRITKTAGTYGGQGYGFFHLMYNHF